VIAGWVRVLDASHRPIRDPENRATDTRVRPVPAVAIRGRAESVADDMAERPVHARTSTIAARARRRRVVTCRSGLVTAAPMCMRAPVDSTKEVTKRRIAPPTLDSNPHDSAMAGPRDALGRREYRDATPCS
jgi:hypothetical protein